MTQTILLCILQVTLLATIFYWVMRALKGTPGLTQICSCIITLAMIHACASWAKMPLLQWILEKIFTFLPVIIVVLFQTEIKKILGNIAQKLHLNIRPTKPTQDNENGELIASICQSIANMSATQTGALIAIEQNMNLDVRCQQGKRLDAMLVPYNAALETIFYKGCPLHDGGVIIRKGRLDAASCPFPLCEDIQIRADYGMRHQAATGLSEQTDALVIVVSEETGDIHLVRDGKMTLMENANALAKTLREYLVPKEKTLSAGQSIFLKLKALQKFYFKKQPEKADSQESPRI